MANKHEGEEPVGWVTIKGKHFPKWADGTIGWQSGQESLPKSVKSEKIDVRTKEGRKLNAQRIYEERTREEQEKRANEVLAISKTLDKGETATTYDYEIASMYKANKNSNFDFDVRENNPGVYSISAKRRSAAENTADTISKMGRDERRNYLNDAPVGTKIGGYYSLRTGEEVTVEKTEGYTDVFTQAAGRQKLHETYWSINGQRDNLPARTLRTAGEGTHASLTTDKKLAARAKADYEKKIAAARAERQSATKKWDNDKQQFVEKTPTSRNAKYDTGRATKKSGKSNNDNPFERRVSNLQNAKENLTMLKAELKKHPNDVHTAYIKKQVKEAEDFYKRLKAGDTSDPRFKPSK